MPRITTNKPAPKKKVAKKSPAKKAPAKRKAAANTEKNKPVTPPIDGKDPTTGRFAKGNKWWEVRSSHGRSPEFETAQELWNACCEYFEWVEENPLWESKATQFQGVQVDMVVPKMRPMTIDGLCIFLGITDQTLYNYKERGPDFLEVITMADKIIRTQKFAGAAADLLNANIIARDLGLRDEARHEHTGPGGGPIQAITSEMDPQEASRLYKEMLSGLSKS